MNQSLLLSEIMRKEEVYTLFQPIVDLKNADIIGYEALSRGPQDSALHSPTKLIEQATKDNRLWMLEVLFREKAINAASKLGITSLLFLNVDPNVMNDPNFTSGFTRLYLEDHGLMPEKIVFEITERSVVENFKSFRLALQHYTDQGYRTAIDDTGAGYSNLAMFSQIKPNFIKIDMDLVRSVDTDTFKQAIIKSFVWLANYTNTQLIAEGIETIGEAKMLISLGVHAGQGYLLGKPSPELIEIDREVRQEIIQTNNSSALMNSYTANHIGDICECVKSFEVDTRCIDIKQVFDREKIEGACIISREHIVGLIMRNRLNATMSGQFGFSLHAHKTISALMDSSCLIVDYNTPISTVSELALARDNERVYDNIIVTRNFRYCGMVSILNLLKHSSDIERSFALELNPLTGLPGNIQINKVLYEFINESSECCVLYFDLDNFKIYNDAYGFKQGDSIIKMTKDILCYNINKKFAVTSFIGHIGGDDFIAIMHCDKLDCEELCKKIISDFSREIVHYFSEEDLERGYLVGKPRGNQAVECIFPLTSISIAVLCGNMAVFETPDRLSYQLSDLKGIVKGLSGSNFMIQDV